MCHPIQRAYERYKIDLTHFDLAMITIMLNSGIGKELNNYNSELNRRRGGKLYHIRYGGKLLAPVIVGLEDKATIVTFLDIKKGHTCVKNKKLTKNDYKKLRNVKN